MCPSLCLTRLAPRIAAVLLACQLTHPVQAIIRDGGIDPSNLGKGDWIYILPNAINRMGGNVPGVTDLRSMMIFLKNQGLRYIIIKAGNGDSLYPSTASPQFTADVVNAGHAAGLWVFGYNRSFGINIPGEIGVADYVFDVGADGFVFDAEAEWESQYLANNTTKAVQLCSAVRSNWPSKFLAHSPLPIISYHSSFPYKEFGYYCDAVMPQDYWIEIGVTPTYMVSWMNSQWTSWQNGLSGQWRNSIKPIVAAGQGWSSSSGTVTAAQVTEFFTALKPQPNPATAGGYKGANFWRAELHPPQVWDAIRTNNIGVFTNAPSIGNVSDDNVTSSSATITWTTEQSSDSVVEYGLDASYGSTITDSTPIYFHTVVVNGLSPAMTYHYRVKSKNANNQVGVSDDYVFTTAAASASDVIIESYLPGPVLNPNPPYSDMGFVGSPSTCKSAATGLTGPADVRYATGGSGMPSVTLRPTLPIAGGSYDVYVTHCGISCSADILVSVGQVNCSGLPGTTPVFQASYANSWAYVGRMTLYPGATVPTVSLTKSGGTLSGSSRMYSDGYKFVYVPPPPLPPAIATQPLNRTNNEGSTAAFTAVASGTPLLFYQWRFNGANIPGATGSAYARNNVQATDAGSYSVLITNGVGSTVSSNAVLTIIVPPTILVQPSDVGTGLGLDATFSVTAIGTPTLQYQWRFNGTNVAGATATSLTISNVQPADAGSYDIVVSNPYGTETSYAALLTFLDPCIAAQPQNRIVAAGGTAVFDVSAVGTQPMNYEWQKDGVDLLNGGSISGADTATLTVANVQWEEMGNYAAVASNVNGSVVSSNATLTGPFRPSVVVQPADQTVSAGSAASFSVAVVGPGTVTFQWQHEGTNLVDSGKISGAATASLTVTAPQAGEMGSYSVLVGNTYGTDASSPALLALSPLVGWGHNGYTQADIPAELTSVTQVAGGLYHSLALKADGTVAVWGAGQTYSGLNPQFGQSVLPDALSNVVAVAGGFYHSLALQADGTVVAWGAGTNNTGVNPCYGQGMVPAAASNVIAIAAGAYHSLALRANGTVVAWGAGASNTGVSPHFGQAAVPAGLSNMVAIAAGVYHSLALKADGTVVAWGAGTQNTGGSPDFGQSEVPAGLSNVVAIAGGGYHSLVLKSDGTVVAWGAGTNETGGSPDFGQSAVPTGLSNVAAIAGGFYHSLALKADGTVVAWGLDNYGQTNAPAAVRDGVGIASGGYHSVVLEGDGSPHFTVQPSTRIAAAGTTISLAAMAVGAEPLSYQWQRNGADVLGANTGVLTLANVQPSDAGSYSVVVSNASGAATSTEAALTVIGTTAPHIDSITSLPKGGSDLRISGGPGNFAIESAPVLSGWTQMTSLTVTGTVFHFTDPETNQANRFYRVRVIP